MPIIHFINSKSQSTGSMKNVLGYVSKEEKTQQENKRFVTALNCSPQTCHEEFILIAKRRTFQEHDYAEYTCNSHHRYGKQYCTPYRIHEEQLDELVQGEVRLLRLHIKELCGKYDQIIRDWMRQKPQYEQRIQQYTDRISILKESHHGINQ